MDIKQMLPLILLTIFLFVGIPLLERRSDSKSNHPDQTEKSRNQNIAMRSKTMKTNLTQIILLILYPATLWVSLLFATPYETALHASGLTIHQYEYHPIWIKKEEQFSSLNYHLIWIEIFLITATFTCALLISSKLSRNGRPTPIKHAHSPSPEMQSPETIDSQKHEPHDSWDEKGMF